MSRALCGRTRIAPWIAGALWPRTSGWSCAPPRAEGPRGDLPSVDESFEGSPTGRPLDRLGAARGYPPGRRGRRADHIPQNRSATFARFLSRIGGPVEAALRLPPYRSAPRALEHLLSGQRYEVNGPQASAPSDEIFSNEPRLARQSEQRYLLQVVTQQPSPVLMRRLRSQGSGRVPGRRDADHGLSFKRGTDRACLARTSRDRSGAALHQDRPAERPDRQVAYPYGRNPPEDAEILASALLRTDPLASSAYRWTMSAPRTRSSTASPELSIESWPLRRTPTGSTRSDERPRAECCGRDTSVLVDGHTRASICTRTPFPRSSRVSCRARIRPGGVVVNDGCRVARRAPRTRAVLAVINPRPSARRNQVEIVGSRPVYAAAERPNLPARRARSDRVRAHPHRVRAISDFEINHSIAPQHAPNAAATHPRLRTAFVPNRSQHTPIYPFPTTALPHNPPTTSLTTHTSHSLRG